MSFDVSFASLGSTEIEVVAAWGGDIVVNTATPSVEVEIKTESFVVDVEPPQPTVEIQVVTAWSGNFILDIVAPAIEVEIVGGPPGGKGDKGDQGNQGDKGDQGEPGPMALPYVHNQAVAAVEWIVNHNLGRKPAGVEVLTPGGVAVLADIRHITENQLRVYLAAPASGFVLAL